MIKLKQKDQERVVYEGTLFQVLQTTMITGDKEILFERVQRAPGTRLLIVKNGKILLTTEFRYELKADDYRLPGGKVFDTLQEYQQALRSGKNIQEEAHKAAVRECEEETGLTPLNMKLLHRTAPDATVIWNLFYFLVDDFQIRKTRQNPEEGEIIKWAWFPFDKVQKMCLNHEIKEDRTVAVLLTFLLTQGHKPQSL